MKTSGNKKGAFTIVELLTVMSIIVILITILVPALNKVRHYAKDVKQRSQLHSIEAALEQFHAELDGYPKSVDNANLATPLDSYCGAMKLAEALVGKDLQGYHPAAQFISDPTQSEKDTSGNWLYPPKAWATANDELYKENLRTRKGPYLQLENANAYRMKNIYPTTTAGQIYTQNTENYVLCDVYGRVTLQDPGNEGIYGKTGMPILYYKANTFNTLHDANTANSYDNIYDYEDNDALVELGAPWDDSGTTIHPLHQFLGGTLGAKFYEMTRNKNISNTLLPDVPVRKDSYILISAGNDGLYGTADDITNFN